MKARGAFTILEVVLVLTVMVLLASIAAPSIETMYGELRLNAAADMVRARWAEARAKATEDGVAYRFAVKPGSGDFRIAPDAGDYWSGGGAPLNESDEPPLVVDGTLPTGVQFTAVDGGESTDWQRVVTFLPDGSSRENVEIVFRSAGQRPLVMRLQGITGAITTHFQTLGR